MLSLGVGERLGGPTVVESTERLLLLDVEPREGGASCVLRVRKVVSAEGGGGSEASRDARQRKHSPLPK